MRPPIQPGGDRGGFSFVELIVAIIILAVGLAGMAATTALSVRQVTVAEVATERTAALQSAIEHVRSLDYDDVGSGSRPVGLYEVSWTTEEIGVSKVVTLVTTGAGLASSEDGYPRIHQEVTDTFTYRILGGSQ